MTFFELTVKEKIFQFYLSTKIFEGKCSSLLGMHVSKANMTGLKSAANLEFAIYTVQ